MRGEAAPYVFARRLSRRLPFFYGWVIVYIAFLSVFLTGATTFFGLQLFVAPMHEDTGWSHASIFAGMFVRFVAGSFAGFLLGPFADRRGGPQRMLLAGVLIDAASMFALRWVETPAQFLLLYGVAGGIGSTGMRLVQAALVPKWFVARRGSAVSFATLGGGMSALVMVPVVALLIEETGWRDAWSALGVIILVTVLPCVPLAVRAPEDIGLLPDGGEAAQFAGRRRTAATELSYTLKGALRTWQLWVLLLATLCGAYSLNAGSVLLVPYFREIGFSATTAAAAVSVYGLFSVGARFLWGYSADRFGVRPAMVAQALLTGMGSVFLLQIEDRTGLYLVVSFLGLNLGGFPALAQLAWPEFFGRAHVGSIVGFTQLFTTFASAAGPFIGGLVHDHTGSYEAPLASLAVSWFACALFMFAVRPLRRPEAAPAGVAALE